MGAVNAVRSKKEENRMTGIEMRILRRSKTDYNEDGVAVGIIRTPDVLQFRERIDRNTTTEWRDVPISGETHGV